MKTLAVALIILGTVALADANPLDEPSLREALSRSRHEFRRIDEVAGEWRASSPLHGVTARISPAGLKLQLAPSGGKGDSREIGWRTTAYGYGDAMRAIADHADIVAVPGALPRLEIRRQGITEWFVNRPDGLEQGYTLSTRPDGNETGVPLRVLIAIGGGLHAEVSDDGRHVILRDKLDGPEVLRYEKLKVWDSKGHEIPARMKTDASGLTLEVDDAGAVYPLTIDPVFVRQGYLKASNLNNGDKLGYSVAIDGDTAVVGAPFEDGNATDVNGPDNNLAIDAGAAYVFVRSGGVWTEQAYLKASNSQADDRFGNSVAIHGDTAVVGAFFEDGASSSVVGNYNDFRPLAGAAYVFVRSGGTWAQQAYLKASNAGADDLFGQEVAISGDSLIVGAYQESGSSTIVNGPNDDLASQAGAAYIFVRNAGVWTQQAYLKAFNAAIEDNFGISVDIDGDTALVGAYNEDSNATGVGGNGGNNTSPNSGAAYTFKRNAGIWTADAYLKASNTGDADLFGASVAIDGNVAAVSAIREKSAATGVNGDEANDSLSMAGAVYVFRNTAGVWSQEAYLKASNTDSNDEFGHDIALSGNRIAVASFQEESASTVSDTGGDDNSAENAGAVYVFSKTGATWAQDSYLKAFNAAESDFFGFSIGLDGSTVVSGAPFEDEGFDTSGAVYVFDLPGVSSLKKPKKFKPTAVGSRSKSLSVTIRNTGPSPLSGLSVKTSGKGKKDFLVGKPGLTLAPGASTTFKVTFRPRKAGSRKATLTVSSDGAPVSVKLAGTGK
jgi:hypothetical protein